MNQKLGSRATLIRTATLLALGCLTNAFPAGAQRPQSNPPPGVVAGVIVDATSGDRLRGAVVVLEPRSAGSLRVSGSEVLWSRGLSVHTDESGSYRFSNISQGEFRLLIRRMGYRPATVYLDLTKTNRLSVSVGLTVQPIRLERAVGTAPAPVTFNTSAAGLELASETRLQAERFRQDLFLESDVRLVSERDVVEAVTLAESDVFRALHRTPGVTTRDEFTAELWTRGAPWSHTRVYFDGMPLFNPVHSAGVFSGVNPDGLGTVFFHPGSRSASIGEGAAGVLNLTSRRWDGESVGGTVGLSVASARLLIGGPFLNGGTWSVATRRSYVDLLTGFLSDSTLRIPYSFLDFTTRVDLPLGSNSALTASWLWGRDAVWGTVRKMLRGNDGRWGNTAGQVSLSTQWGNLFTKHTLGFSRFTGNMSILEFVTSSNSGIATPRHAPVKNNLTYLTFRSRIEPSDASSANSWAIGYDLEFQRQEFQGPYPRPYPTVEVNRTFGRWAEQLRLAVWGERRLKLGDLALQLGLRSELAGEVANTTPVGIAPRVSARYDLSPNLTMSAGFSRSFQYTQAIAPAGPGIGPDLHVTDVWLLASDTIPAIRSDIKTVGAEVFFGTGWLGSATLYSRNATGLAIPDPTPGARLLDSSVFVPATNSAHGFEFSLRRLVGPITTSFSYAFGISRMSGAGFRFPSTSARQHEIDLTASLRLLSSVRVGGALLAASGAPFTRIHLGPIGCVSGEIVCPDTLFTTTLVENPAAAKTPPYVSLDLIAEWVKEFHNWRLGITVQVKNVLHRQNAMTYLGTYSGCTQTTSLSRMVTPGVCDRYYQGLPLLPLVGVYARF